MPRPDDGVAVRLPMGALIVSALLGGAPQAFASAEPVCVAVVPERGVATVLAASVDDEVRLTFRNSVFASTVVERLRVGSDGFRLVRLDYAEPRLAEFYGHDSGRWEAGWWVVEGDGRYIASIVVRPASDSGFRLEVGESTIALTAPSATGSSMRLAISACAEGS